MKEDNGGFNVPETDLLRQEIDFLTSALSTHKTELKLLSDRIAALESKSGAGWKPADDGYATAARSSMEDNMLKLQSVVDSALELLQEPNEAQKSARAVLPWIQYVFEYRTIGINVPRGIGKTEYLLSHQSKVNSLVLFHSYNMMLRSEPTLESKNSKFYCASDCYKIQYDHAGVSKEPYDCLLIDEPGYMRDDQKESLMRSLDYLRAHALLADDFYILALGTNPRRIM